MNETKPSDGNKQPYVAPKILRIDLAAEEVLAEGCKLSNGGTSFGASPCTLNSCAQAGS